MQTRFRKFTSIALASALPLVFSAQGFSEARDSSMKMDESKSEQQHTDWQKMREQVINANEILSGEVTNGFNTMGQVRDLILSEDGSRVEYILYEVPTLWAGYGSEDGFVVFDNVEFNSSFDASVNVRIDEGAKQEAKDELKLKKSQTDHRLVSNIIGESLHFDNDKGNTRDVENLLVDRKSGKVTHYVVQMDPESLFNEAPRAIPASKIKVDSKGRISTDMTLSKVDSMKDDYAPEFLK